MFWDRALTNPLLNGLDCQTPQVIPGTSCNLPIIPSVYDAGVKTNCKSGKSISDDDFKKAPTCAGL